MVIKIRPDIKGQKGKKNPELMINGKIAENKEIESYKGIRDGFNKAYRQGCSAVVINLDKHIKTFTPNEVRKNLKGRHDFTNGIIEECYVIWNGRSVIIRPEDKEQIAEIVKKLEP